MRCMSLLMVYRACEMPLAPQSPDAPAAVQHISW